MLRYLPRELHILDVGCGSGFSTSIFAKSASQVTGIDYSEKMIERAKKNFGNISNIDFQVHNILKLDFPSESFDVVISQRCLINLSTWEEQKKAICDISEVLKPGGYFFLQEGTQQGRDKLNYVREMLELTRMPPVSYNLDFDETILWPFIRRFFDIVEIRRFGLYDLISRIVHPLLVSPLEPSYDAKINEIARMVAIQLRGLGEISREFSAFLRKSQKK